MSTGELLKSSWDWEPSVVAGCAILAAGYLALLRRRASRRAVWFLTGVLLLLLDLVSPIDFLGDTYLFSAHVLQHFLLALVIPPLLLLGTPPDFAAVALKRPLIAGVERVLASPFLAWPLGVGAMLAWHIPVFFNAALANYGLHIAQHLSFLVTGTIFWWPVLQPDHARRLAPLAGMAYLFSACTACSVLGAYLTFGPAGLYPAYTNPPDGSGTLALIRDGWGLDSKNDQQLGGMLMWVPGCLVYLTGILTIAARWYGAPQEVRG